MGLLGGVHSPVRRRTEGKGKGKNRNRPERTKRWQMQAVAGRRPGGKSQGGEQQSQAGWSKSQLRTERDRSTFRKEGEISYLGVLEPEGQETLADPRCLCSHLWIPRMGPRHSPPGEGAAFVPSAQPPWGSGEGWTKSMQRPGPLYPRPGPP